MKKENKAFKIFRVIITLIAIVFLLLFVSGALWGIVNIGNLVGGLLCVWLIFVFGTRNKYKSLKEKLKKNIFGKIVLYGINFLLYRTSLLRFDCYGSNDICLHTTAKTKCNRNRTWRSSYRERPEYDAYRQNKQRR